jgi:iron complex outermembrane recepter protein
MKTPSRKLNQTSASFAFSVFLLPPFALCLLVSAASAANFPSATNLAELSIEQLANVEVTSVSKKEQRLADAPAAAFVLSDEDIRRSGATTIVDALRLVPGMQVAALGANDWAVTARGFNSQFANKLLVMIDGRTVYSPLFSGVYWDVQQMLLDDVDRIEAIRGPGAAIWGANAVNGVINILSKSARDTQGALIYGGGGSEHLVLGGARYGDQIGENTFYRLYGTYQLNDQFHSSAGTSLNDNWDLAKAGFRLDHFTRGEAQLTWQGDAHTGNVFDHTGDLHGFNTLGRWTQHLTGRSSYELQAFVDHSFRDDALARASVSTADLSGQHNFGLGQRQDIIWGWGYRYIRSELARANTPALTIVDPDKDVNLISAFVQDEIQIVPEKLTITLGTKVEHNDFTGFEIQPSARLTIKPSENQTVWAAVSRAVRTPSEAEGMDFIAFTTGGPQPGPGGLYLPVFIGNPDLESETLLAYELGYRIQPCSQVSADFALFYNDYDELTGRTPVAFVPGTPFGTLAIQSVNSLTAESYGGEAVVSYAPLENWRLSASYSLLLLNAHGNPSDAEAAELNSPTHQVVLRSSWELLGPAFRVLSPESGVRSRDSRLSLDVQLRYVDNVQNVPAYLTADVGLTWRPCADLELRVVGQNLLDDQHPEQASLIGAPTAEVPRGIYGKITWRF